ncbi:helix-turn-helix domain-containing protein [Halobacillus seohaensis]|uniref:Helix-turn-helix domain-containing protein n=1 Tax=Halobacillus seohaensis TaxID=447421 RepID=A0ABW2EHX3_9BACI
MDREKIGDVLRVARTGLNLTQSELSGLVGISRNYISDIENGRYTPSFETLIKVTNQLEIDLNTLTS